MNEAGVPVLQVVFWTLGGILLGFVLGYQTRIVIAARAAAEKAVAKTEEMEDLIVNQIAPWDGHNRRRSDTGKVEVANAVIIALLVLGLLSAVIGVVASVNAQRQSMCYAQVNEKFAETIEIRAVRGGELEREAQQLDRQALDVLVTAVSLDLDEQAASGNEGDVRPAFRQYREQRQKADALRAEADQVREDNPYPSADQCE